jgi:transposase
MNYVGIDVSKLTFDVAIEQQGKYDHYKFSNDRSGFKELLNLLKKDTHRCVMEASGPYYQRLAVCLNNHEITLSVVNPLVIRRFCQMRLVKAKTDKKDAVMIAEYGKTEHPRAWQPTADYLLELKQLQSYLDQLDKQRTGFIRHLEAFEQNPVINKQVKKSILKMIKSSKMEMEKIEAQMQELITIHHQQLYENIKTIPGVGKKTSLLLIVISGGFEKFENAKQLSAYVGLSPRIFQSGSSVKGKAKICKMGMGKIRAMLYMCACSAIKFNKACRLLYERLVAKGKAKLLALIAVANKLLKQAFAIAKSGEIYREIIV